MTKASGVHRKTLDTFALKTSPTGILKVDKSPLVNGLSPPHLNTNLYTRMLNTSYDYSKLQGQFEHASSPQLREAVDFIAVRAEKFETILNCLTRLVGNNRLHSSMQSLFDCMVKILDAEHATLYKVDTVSNEFVSLVSTWSPRDARYSEDKLIGVGQCVRHLQDFISNGEGAEALLPINIFDYKSAENFYKAGLEENVYGFEVDSIAYFPVYNGVHGQDAVLEIINKASHIKDPQAPAEDHSHHRHGPSAQKMNLC